MIKQKISIGLVLFCTLLSSLSAQPHQKSSTLKTDGKGEIKVTPDWTIVRMEIIAKSMVFNEAVENLNKKYNILEKELTSAGFTKPDIKTDGYTVNKNIQYTQKGQVDSGYIGRQSFTIEFPNEQKQLIKLVKTFTNSKTNLSYHFTFTLSTQKKKQTENELIKRAVLDAKDKAQLLAGSSGVTLKKITHIDYGKTEYASRSYALITKEAHDGGSSFEGFNVQDLELSDQVTIIWEIE